MENFPFLSLGRWIEFIQTTFVWVSLYSKLRKPTSRSCLPVHPYWCYILISSLFTPLSHLHTLLRRFWKMLSIGFKINCLAFQLFSRYYFSSVYCLNHNKNPFFVFNCFCLQVITMIFTHIRLHFWNACDNKKRKNLKAL